MEIRHRETHDEKHAENTPENTGTGNAPRSGSKGMHRSETAEHGNGVSDDKPRGKESRKEAEKESAGVKEKPGREGSDASISETTKKIDSIKLDKLKELFDKSKNPERSGLSIDRNVKDLPFEKLGAADAASFQDGKYRKVEVTDDLTLYRVYGGGSGREGSPGNPRIYLSTALPTDRMYEKMNSALTNYYPRFKPRTADESAEQRKSQEVQYSDKHIDMIEVRPNSRQYYCEVTVPKGTAMFIGIAAAQETKGGQRLPGGGEQVLVDKRAVKFGDEKSLNGYQGYHQFENKARKLEGETPRKPEKESAKDLVNRRTPEVEALDARCTFRPAGPESVKYRPVENEKNAKVIQMLRSFGEVGVIYKKGVPDFSPFCVHDTLWGRIRCEVQIGYMSANRRNPSWEYGRREDSHDLKADLGNYEQADVALAERIKSLKRLGIQDSDTHDEKGRIIREKRNQYDGEVQKLASDIAKYRVKNHLTWHEADYGSMTMQLIPTTIHSFFSHTGAVAEAKVVSALADVDKN